MSSNHHAYVLEGGREWALRQIPNEFRTESADVSIRSFDRMTIADARTLIYDSGLMPTQGRVRAFILDVGIILTEAQNALLKLFEDPQDTARFYVIIPRLDTLLPTLRSRLHHLGSEERKGVTDAFTTFLAQSPKERIESIGMKAKEEETVWFLQVIQGFEQYAHSTRDVSLMKDAQMLVTYAHLSGSSRKMLLEHIALSL